MEQRSELIKERAEGKSEKAKIPRLEECMRAAAEALEVLCVVGARVEKSMAEHASLTAGTGQLKVEQETLAACICKLEVAAAPHYGELGVVVRPVLWCGQCGLSKVRLQWARLGKKAEARARETLDSMPELCALVKTGNLPVGCEHAFAAGLVHEELVRFRLLTTSGLSESNGTVSKAIYDVHDGLPINQSSGRPTCFAGVRLIRHRSCSSFDLFSLALVSVVNFSTSACCRIVSSFSLLCYCNKTNAITFCSSVKWLAAFSSSFDT